MRKRVFALTCSVFLSQSAFADNNIQSVIDSFTNCDSSFFYQLKANSEEFQSKITNLVVEDDIAYIPIDNDQVSETNTNYFKEPIIYRGLTLAGYQNIRIETLSSGRYYYWGFVINGSVDSIEKSLSQLQWQRYNVTSYIANSQLFDSTAKKSGWQVNLYIIDGVIPRIGTVEKSLYLEPINENQVHLICSMQGDVTKSLLYAIRPDMKYINQDKLDNKQILISSEK